MSKPEWGREIALVRAALTDRFEGLLAFRRNEVVLVLRERLRDPSAPPILLWRRLKLPRLVRAEAVLAREHDGEDPSRILASRGRFVTSKVMKREVWFALIATVASVVP